MFWKNKYVPVPGDTVTIEKEIDKINNLDYNKPIGIQSDRVISRLPPTDTDKLSGIRRERRWEQMYREIIKKALQIAGLLLQILSEFV